MNVYNLLEYSDNYADTSGSLYQLKRDESPMDDAGNLINVAIDNSLYFKYKSSILGKTTDADGNDRSFKNVNAVVPLKYLSNFWQSSEMPLINCKIHLELSWTKNCVMYGDDAYAADDDNNNRATTLEITNTKLYVPIITVSAKDNVNFTKQLNEGFKRLVYWNAYKAKIETKKADENLTRFYLDASFQGVERLLVIAFNNTNAASNADGPNKVKRSSHTKYFLPRVNITNCNALIDGRKSEVCTVLEKSKEKVLEFYKGTTKILSEYKWLNTIK